MLDGELNGENLLRAAFRAAIAAADPLELPAHVFPEPPVGRLVVVGAGKAAAAMALAAERHYGERFGSECLAGGLVVTRYGHGLKEGEKLARIRVIEAAHPVPDAAGLAAAREIHALAASLGENDLLLCLLSGGGSALLTAPEGVSLEEKAALTKALLRSGADIREMNSLRKHLSSLKGGRLAAAAAPARVVSLIISDVAGDDLSSVASGPTAPDPTTYEDALAVLDRYGLDFPAARAQLERGARGELAETPKEGDAVFERVENRLVATAQDALEAAARAFESQGVTPLILADAVTGEAREVGKVFAAITSQVLRHGQPLPRPCALLSGGETTVTVRGEGKGGRNSEFLLSFALELGMPDGVYALAADSDGIDGFSDAAGALVGPDLFARVERDAAKHCLENNDSYSLFEKSGALIKTGPTRTNVNDLRFILVR
ncbi:glycerate kinase [soil metagenome]